MFLDGDVDDKLLKQLIDHSVEEVLKKFTKKCVPNMKPCPDTFPFPLVALDETASTNQYLSQLCNQLQESVAELTTVTAEFQTAGKGQRGNTWEAEEGKNLLSALYSTLLFWKPAGSSSFHKSFPSPLRKS